MTAAPEMTPLGDDPAARGVPEARIIPVMRGASLEPSAWAVEIDTPQGPAKLAEFAVEGLASMFVQYWNSGWFTTGEAVCAVSETSLHVSASHAFVMQVIDGRRRMVLKLPKEKIGASTADPINMIRGYREPSSQH